MRVARAILLMVALAGCSSPPHRPIVIAHRGASGLRPEHTLAAYQLAIEQGADFIEPDLVVTRDGVLIARHENEISESTNVSDVAKFAGRKTTKVIDGVEHTGWFTEDFTLAEIKELRAREPMPDRQGSAAFNDRFEIPTLAEIIDLARAADRPVGIYPETKHPTFFREELGVSIGGLLIKELVRHDFTDPDRVFIQSFEFANLIELKRTIMPENGVDIPLVQLYGDTTNRFVPPVSCFSVPYDMRFNASRGRDLKAIYGDLADLVGITDRTGYGDLTSAAVVRWIKSTYAAGCGPWKMTILPRVPINSELAIPTRLTGEVDPFLGRLLDAGLLVHPYTLRAEERFLTLNPDGTPQEFHDEIAQIIGLGVHGFFIEHPADGVLVRDRLFRP
jgi:glycerophosphoryl diester phosphodiesterase